LVHKQLNGSAHRDEDGVVQSAYLPEILPDMECRVERVMVVLVVMAETVCCEHELTLLCGMGSGHALSISLRIYDEDPVGSQLSQAHSHHGS